MGESDSRDVGGAAERTRRVIRIPALVGEPIAIIAKRGGVSAVIEWDDNLFVFRFRDERPEAARVLGATQEHEFSWSPDSGVRVEDGSDKGPPSV
jgi:hypothetical protein